MSTPNKRAYHRAYMSSKRSLRNIPENHKHYNQSNESSTDHVNINENVYEHNIESNENEFIEGKYNI